MAEMSQAQARSAAIAAGNSAEEVDAFIAREGGARTSAQRITSAFNVPAAKMTGGNNPMTPIATTSPVHAPGSPADGDWGNPPSPGSGTTAPGSMTGLDTVLSPTGSGGGASTPSVQAMSAGDGGDVGGLISSGMGSMRQLGQRIPSQDSMALAGLGRRVY